MKHKITKKQVISCLEDLIDQDPHGLICDDKWLDNYFADKDKLECLMVLNSYDVVSLRYFDGRDIPSIISIESDAYALLHQVYNDRRNEIKGIIEGVISTVAAEIILIIILKLVPILLSLIQQGQ